MPPVSFIPYRIHHGIDVRAKKKKAEQLGHTSLLDVVTPRSEEQGAVEEESQRNINSLRLRRHLVDLHVPHTELAVVENAVQQRFPRLFHMDSEEFSEVLQIVSGSIFYIHFARAVVLEADGINVMESENVANEQEKTASR